MKKLLKTELMRIYFHFSRDRLTPPYFTIHPKLYTRVCNENKNDLFTCSTKARSEYGELPLIIANGFVDWAIKNRSTVSHCVS